MHRIHKFTLKNFKFFHGEASINPNGKNILLYGENGSGKSSIYWALYTFLQSVFKTEPQQIVKYFAYNHPENLRNRYANDEEGSSIVVEFDDGVSRTISNEGVDLKQDADDKLVFEATLGSDLIEYRTLARIYHFAHSEEVDLFPFFRSNLLPFINFTKPFTKHDSGSGSKNSQDFWSYLERGLDIKTAEDDDKTMDLFTSIVDLFNSEFENYLNTITESVNEYLNEDFKHGVKVRLRFEKASIREVQDEDRKNIYADPPRIILDVWLVTDKIPEVRKKIFNPQSFLNESKLTALALSIRLAILDEKFVEEYPKILVLDDFLMSMDMSNREAVLEVILKNYLDHYQIFFLTHQRGLFEDAKKFIELFHSERLRRVGESNPEVLASEWQNHWEVYEMYEVENNLGYSTPRIQQYGTNLQKALYYFNEQIDYNACGNNLRAALEEFLIRFIPSKHRVHGNMLAGLLVSARDYFNHVGFDTTPLDKLERYRERSLNPSSHYNPRTDFFKLELKDVFTILELLKRNRNDVVLNRDEKVRFTIKTTGISHYYTALLLDDVRLYKRYDDSPSFFVDDDKRGYVMIEYKEGDNKARELNVPIRGLTLTELYYDTAKGLPKKYKPILRNNIYRVFTAESGTPLIDLKIY